MIIPSKAVYVYRIAFALVIPPDFVEELLWLTVFGAKNAAPGNAVSCVQLDFACCLIAGALYLGCTS